MTHLKHCGLLAILLLSLMPATAQAQLNNRPFSFNTPSGSVGMSLGGRQAIINDKLFNVHPDNLVRGTGGVLVDVAKGPGNSAITFRYGTGESIPGFRGTSFRGDNTDMAAGVFNAYFSPSAGKSSGLNTYAHIHTGATVSTWTARITSGGVPVSYLGAANPVDAWTGQVHSMGPY